MVDDKKKYVAKMMHSADGKTHCCMIFEIKRKKED